MMILCILLIGVIFSSMITTDETQDPKSKEPYDPEINLVTEDPIVGEEVKFNISGIPNGTYSRWSIPKDGVNIEGPELTHVFSSSGPYHVILETTYHGMVEFRNFTFTVRDPIYPKAQFKIDRYHDDILPGDLIGFNGSLSGDMDGNIVSYHWRIENKTISGKVVYHHFIEPGEKSIEFTVTDNDGLSSTTSKVLEVLSYDELIRKDLSIDVQMEKPSYYVDDPLNITLKLKNNGSRSFHINPFGPDNLMIDLSTEFSDYKCFPYKFDLSSLYVDLIENRTWSEPQDKIRIDPGDTLTAEFDIKNIQIFMEDQGEGEDWRTIDWFIRRYMDIRWLRAYVHFMIAFIPGNNISSTIRSDRFDVYLEWKPIHEYIFDRQIDNETEEEILEYAETMDYVNITGRERWYQQGVPVFIDELMIMEFTRRYESQINNTDLKAHVLFNYTASIHFIDNISFDPQTLDTVFYFGNGSSLPYDHHGVNIKHPEWEYKDQELLNETDLNETNCYMVKMVLRYSVISGPLGGNFWFNYQWVAVTEDLVPLYILSEPGYGVS